MTNRQSIRKFLYTILLEKTIRGGLLLSMPFLAIGSAALTIRSIPVDAYQLWIRALLDGRAYEILLSINTYTLDIIPLILIFTMSFSFGKAVSNNSTEILYYPLTTFCSYLIFLKPQGSLLFSDLFSAMQTFVSMLTTLICCTLLYLLRNWKPLNLQSYVGVPRNTFSIFYRMVIPCSVVFFLFAVFNIFFTPNIEGVAEYFHLRIFTYLGNNFLSTFIFILIEHAYSFVGIHGGNVLNAVATTLFEPRMINNTQTLALGQVPSEIYTKTFLDAFVIYGGSGATLALAVSIFLFGKITHTRHIAKISLLPCLFNINEILILGLPVICNPIFFIPFLLVPLVSLTVSAIAMNLGIVPVAAHAVEWTTPVLLSGYLSTGSIAGSLLQIFTFILGVFIYKPFLKYYENLSVKNFQKKFHSLVDETAACEETGKIPLFLNHPTFSSVANVLTFDLRQAMERNEIELHYQPQICYDGSVYGAEALLRWRHPQVGIVYPPLLISLANERGFLDELGLYLIEKVCKDLQYMTEQLGHPIKLSVNLSPVQLHHPLFCHQIQEMLKKYHWGKSILSFEVTEQIALLSTPEIRERLMYLKSMGILLSMDDFGMGHSSVVYLQDSDFDVVKLDGSLVKKVLTSERCIDIIRAIHQLSEKFKFKVIAEFVETAEQREKLASLGCYIYQGWLYSKSLPLEQFLCYIKKQELAAKERDVQ